MCDRPVNSRSPLNEKRSDFPPKKAGALKVASSVKAAKSWPPVMVLRHFDGSMYVRLPYFDVVTIAFRPAVISYIGLVYHCGISRSFEGRIWRGCRGPTRPTHRAALIGIAFNHCIHAVRIFVLRSKLPAWAWLRPAFPLQAPISLFVLMHFRLRPLLVRVAFQKKAPLELR